MAVRSKLGTRKSPTKLRLALIFLTALLFMLGWNLMGPGAQAAQAKEPCTIKTYVAFAGYVEKPCTKSFDDVISPDTRQALGGAAGACAVGWWAGGPQGCGMAALGSLVGSIPWDGTWD